MQGNPTSNQYRPPSSYFHEPSKYPNNNLPRPVALPPHIETKIPAPHHQPKRSAISAGFEGFEDADEDEGKEAGRRKIKIEYIEDKSRRHITFSKRKAGIMKKAYELSTLTGTQVLLLVASENGHVYTFATPKLQPLITKPEGKNMIQTCLNAADVPISRPVSTGYPDRYPTAAPSRPVSAPSYSELKVPYSNPEPQPQDNEMLLPYTQHSNSYTTSYNFAGLPLAHVNMYGSVGAQASSFLSQSPQYGNFGMGNGIRAGQGMGQTRSPSPSQLNGKQDTQSGLSGMSGQPGVQAQHQQRPNFHNSHSSSTQVHEMAHQSPPS